MKRSQNPFRALSGVLVALALVATGGSAVAQTEPVPVAAPGLRTTPIGRMRLSFSVVPAPLGSVESTVPILGDVSADTAFAFGLRPAFDYSLNEYFFVGFSPQLLLNVKGEDDDDDAGKALDLLLRVGAHAPVADTVHLYGFLSPGYSIIYPSVGDEDPAGFVLGVTAGGMYSITERLFASADIGYQLGFQEFTFGGADYDFHLRYLLIGLGVGMRL
jgi:hypothetical protein